MLHIDYLHGSEMFDADCIPISVRIAEHNKSQNGYHSHTFYEFVYIDRGFSTHFYNNTTSLLTPGDIFGMRPGDVHGYVYPKNTVLYNCLFNPEALQIELEELKRMPGLMHILDDEYPSVWQKIRLDPLSQKEAIGYLERMKYESERRDIGWELKLKGLLIEFLVLFSRCYIQQYSEGDVSEYGYTKYVYKALEYIEEHYFEKFKIEDIASYIGLSTDYFSRIFKQFTGLTPIEYIINVRLAKAVQFLIDPDISIEEVALEVGFKDPGYFSRQFKQVLNMSPSQYQRENSRI